MASLADIAAGIILRSPRLTLVAEAVEDTACHVAEELGPRALIAAMRAVDLAFDGLDAAADGLAHAAEVARLVWALPDILAEASDLVESGRNFVETERALDELRASRIANIQRRLLEIESAFDRSAQ